MSKNNGSKKKNSSYSSKSRSNGYNNSSNFKDCDEIDKFKKELNDRDNTSHNKEKVSEINSYESSDGFEENNILNDTTRKKTDGKLKKNKHVIVHSFLVLLLIFSLVFLGLSIYDKSNSSIVLIRNLILTLFTISFVVICIASNKKNKSIMLVSGVMLLLYFVIDSTSNNNILGATSNIEDFSGKSVTYVMKWAKENNITVKQDYEYSDMVGEYKVISQNITDSKKLKDLGEITISISEGPNPSKEIIVPSMISWDSERVINYVKDNYLSNVSVEFVESDKAVDTVIEQNTSGNLKRDDELKLTFSYGEELGYDEVKLIDFTGKSKFEVEFYMKQHQIRYDFDNEFSSKEKRGYAVSQSVKAGKSVKVNDESVKVTISKGPKIKIPDLKGMDMTEVTEWAIKNKLKLEFSDKYDDSVKENNVISVNYNKGEIIEQGTVVKIVLSRGKLKMPKFKGIEDFRSWADKYEIKYEEKHEFSDSVDAGQVISYSYKKGDVIKNDDTIIVTISDGKKREVPNLKGLTKSEAISKLEKAGLNYNFVYKSSNDVGKDKVISQSISSGSEVSSGTTITVTLSNGKKESSSSNKGNSSSSNKGSNSSSSNGGGSSNSGSQNSGGSGSGTGSNDKPACNPCTITGLRNVYNNNMGSYNNTASALRSHITGQCPGIKVNIVGDNTSGMTPGSPISGFTGGDTTSCSTVTITIAQ